MHRPSPPPEPVLYIRVYPAHSICRPSFGNGRSGCGYYAMASQQHARPGLRAPSAWPQAHIVVSVAAPEAQQSSIHEALAASLCCDPQATGLTCQQGALPTTWVPPGQAELSGVQLCFSSRVVQLLQG